MIRVLPAIFLTGEGVESMKASKFSDAQKMFILKQGDDGVPIGEIYCRSAISQAT